MLMRDVPCASAAPPATTESPNARTVRVAFIPFSTTDVDLLRVAGGQADRVGVAAAT